MRLFVDSASRVDDPYMARALDLAARGLGLTAPNPVVGCVIVAGDVIVGEGFHDRAGGPHAEVVALADAGASAAGATAYVTLEPCNHYGKTPPCTTALIEAGVARVVIGMKDPTREARGGASILADAGIDVMFAENPEPFAELNTGWLKRQVTGVPFITVKVGVSLDGRIALDPGRRASITGKSGSHVTQLLRTRADAVMVGAATVGADDPSLTRRGTDGSVSERQPVRFVLVGTDIPAPTSALMTDGSSPTVLVVPRATPTGDEFAPHVSIAEYDAAAGLRGAFSAIGGLGINNLLVEPGQRLFTALVDAGMIDSLVTVTAGGLAGEGALEMFAGPGYSDRDVLRHLFEPQEAGIVGDVVVVSWLPTEHGETSQVHQAWYAKEGDTCSRD